MRNRLIKFVALSAAGGTLLQLSGCLQDLAIGTYVAFIQSVVTQFLPLGVTEVV